LEAILRAEKRENLLPNFQREGIDDAVLGYLTDADLKSLGIARIGDRRRLLAAFASLSNENIAKAASPMPKASASKPHINSIGLSFVPIPRFGTLVCTYPTRVKDYKLYCAEKDIGTRRSIFASGSPRRNARRG